MSVKIEKVYDGVWGVIHTHMPMFEDRMILDDEEVKELIEEFKEARF